MINDLIKLAQEKRLAGLDVSEELLLIAIATDGISPRSDLTYSYVMRELRRKADEEVVRKFMKEFKAAFEEALDESVNNPEQAALMQALKEIDVEV